jgi:hypothetical protein
MSRHIAPGHPRTPAAQARVDAGRTTVISRNLNVPRFVKIHKMYVVLFLSAGLFALAAAIWVTTVRNRPAAWSRKFG